MIGAGGIYLRVGSSPNNISADRLYREREDDFAFIDIDGMAADDAEEAIEDLKELPHWLGSSRVVLFRWPELRIGGDAAQSAREDESLARFAVKLQSLRTIFAERERVIGIVQFAIGRPPSIKWAGRGAANTKEGELLAHARALEFAALLSAGDAIWDPRTYHYRLPNGDHTGVFIRVADALRTPRDVWSIATWLTPRLRPSVGYLTDSSTLTPLVIQLQAMAGMAGMLPGRAVMLDELPRTRLAFARAATEAAVSGQVIGLVSISSSGSTVSLVHDALEYAAPGAWSLDILVEKGAGRRDSALNWEFLKHRPAVWVSLGGSGVPTEGAKCQHCRDPNRSPLVQIDPRSFAAMSLPAPHQVMPATGEGENSDFWELVSDRNALLIHAPPHPASRDRRGERLRLSVRVDVERLAADATALADAVSRRIGRVLRNPLTETNPSQPTLAGAVEAWTSCCGVVTTRHNLVGMHDEPLEPALRRVLAAFGLEDAPIFSIDSNTGTSDVRQFVESQRLTHPETLPAVLLFAWGAVTGSSMRELRLDVAGALDDLEHRTHGLVVHARPPTTDEWETTVNRFKPGRLAALWLSYLPWESPFHEEARLLDDYGAEHPLPGTLLARLRSINEAAGQPQLWGTRESEPGFSRVRGRSLYGNSITATAAYAALGAAIHRQRLITAAPGAPRWVKFNMPRIARSYFDGIIVAAILHWIEPGEAWWGADVEEERATMRTLLDGFHHDPSHWAVIVPELLIAGALGKVPLAALQELDESMSLILGSLRNSADNSWLEAVTESLRGVLVWALRQRTT